MLVYPESANGGRRAAPVSNPVAHLRNFTADDFETLYRIDQECFPRGICYSRRTLRWFLALHGAECIVAEREGAITGFILTQAENQQGQIITLDVLEAHRRSGIGARLLAEAERRMAARGVCTIQLETAHDNAPAIAFWQKHGYRTEAVLKNYYLGKQDALGMRKVLPA